MVHRAVEGQRAVEETVSSKALARVNQLITPNPRYISSKCCTKEHIKNFGTTDHETEIIEGLEKNPQNCEELGNGLILRLI
jgi:hypothetical protein